MKKRILLLSFASLLCSASSSFARDANPVKVKCFEANGVMVYDVQGCVPGSDISFYSTIGGGVMMKQVTVNANGSARVVWNQPAAPAFVLNNLAKNSQGIVGNGMVTYTDDKEFVVNNVALDNSGSAVTVKWTGAVNNTSDYAFEVLKSVNGSDWTLVQTVNAQSAEALPYSYTEASQAEATAMYQVRVVNTNREAPYTSNPLSADGSNGISVYPTVAQSSINIKLNDARNSSYRVLNMNGQVVISGSLNNAINSCSVATLPAGNYLVEVTAAGSKTSTKFVKE